MTQQHYSQITSGQNIFPTSSEKYRFTSTTAEVVINRQTKMFLVSSIWFLLLDSDDFAMTRTLSSSSMSQRETGIQEVEMWIL